MDKFELVKASDYVENLIKSIDAAESRICLISTILLDDNTTKKLLVSLKKAAKRGVSVEMAVDIFSYGELLHDLTPIKDWWKRLGKLRTLKKDLKPSGIRFKWLGRAKIFIFTGRSHSKWCAVDDTAYCFGGINLYKNGLESADYMFKIKSKRLANLLFEHYDNILKSDRTGTGYASKNVKYNDNRILIDGGFMGDSIIYRRACQLAEKAKKITLVSQYAPYGKLGTLLSRADSTLYFNDPKNASLLNRLVIKFGMMRNKTESSYRKTRYIHAKFIIFTLKNDKKVAISGSHNLVSGGGLLGTREIAIQTSDPHTIAQLENFIKTELN